MKVNEIFSSLQGEGKYIGKPQVFIRLTGCNMACAWCDTEYAFEKGEEMTADDVLDQVRGYGLKSVCITGGEPMLQLDELTGLVNGLKQEGFEIVLETNGSLYDKDIFEAVDCVSMDMKPPSSGEKSDEGLIEKLQDKDQLKIVIATDADYEFAKGISSKSKVEVLFQPEGDVDISLIANRVIKDRLNVRVLPQLHKVLGLR